MVNLHIPSSISSSSPVHSPLSPAIPRTSSPSPYSSQPPPPPYPSSHHHERTTSSSISNNSDSIGSRKERRLSRPIGPRSPSISTSSSNYNSPISPSGSNHSIISRNPLSSQEEAAPAAPPPPPVASHDYHGGSGDDGSSSITTASTDPWKTPTAGSESTSIYSTTRGGGGYDESIYGTSSRLREDTFGSESIYSTVTVGGGDVNTNTNESGTFGRPSISGDDDDDVGFDNGIGMVEEDGSSSQTQSQSRSGSGSFKSSKKRDPNSNTPGPMMSLDVTRRSTGGGFIVVGGGGGGKSGFGGGGGGGGGGNEGVVATTTLSPPPPPPLTTHMVAATTENDNNGNGNDNANGKNMITTTTTSTSTNPLREEPERLQSIQLSNNDISRPIIKGHGNNQNNNQLYSLAVGNSSTMTQLGNYGSREVVVHGPDDDEEDYYWEGSTARPSGSDSRRESDMSLSSLSNENRGKKKKNKRKNNDVRTDVQEVTSPFLSELQKKKDDGGGGGGSGSSSGFSSRISKFKAEIIDPNYTAKEVEDYTFWDGNYPPTISYKMWDHKWGILGYFTILLLCNVAIPCVLYYVLKAKTDFNLQEIIGIASAAMGVTSCFDAPLRMYKLIRYRKEYGPLNDPIWWHQDFTMHVYSTALLLTAFPLALASAFNPPLVDFFLFTTVLLVAPFGIAMGVSLFGIKAPCWISSDRKGVKMKPAVFYFAEDAMAVEGKGGKEVRRAIHRRYAASPPFRTMLKELTIWWLVGTILYTAATAVVTFFTPLDWSFSWTLGQLFVWLMLWAAGTVIIMNFGFRREERWWKKKRVGGGGGGDDEVGYDELGGGGRDEAEVDRSKRVKVTISDGGEEGMRLAQMAGQRRSSLE